MSTISQPNRLFVYGTLAPGEEYEHFLQPLPGSWQPAWIKGYLHPNGVGPSLGYPALDLKEDGETIEGLLFISPHLSSLWSTLDEFEGEGYKRVVATVSLAEGSLVDAQVYARKL